jgi:hypothetical protein
METAQPDGTGTRKMSNGSTGSTKHKWLKAFKSLKTTPTTPPSNEKLVFYLQLWLQISGNEECLSTDFNNMYNIYLTIQLTYM